MTEKPDPTMKDGKTEVAGGCQHARLCWCSEHKILLTRVHHLSRVDTDRLHHFFHVFFNVLQYCAIQMGMTM